MIHRIVFKGGSALLCISLSENPNSEWIDPGQKEVVRADVPIYLSVDIQQSCAAFGYDTMART